LIAKVDKEAIVFLVVFFYSRRKSMQALLISLLTLSTLCFTNVTAAKSLHDDPSHKIVTTVISQSFVNHQELGLQTLMGLDNYYLRYDLDHIMVRALTNRGGSISLVVSGYRDDRKQLQPRVLAGYSLTPSANGGRFGDDISRAQLFLDGDVYIESITAFFKDPVAHNPPPASTIVELTCESRGGQHTICSTGRTILKIEAFRELNHIDCIYNQNWWFEGQNIHVTNGCSAWFRAITISQ
jgi:hypothetical protein